MLKSGSPAVVHVAGQTVKLTPAEIMQGAMAGVMRQTRHLKEGYNGTHRGPSINWDIMVNGALAEMAFCKYFDLFYIGMGDFAGPDTLSGAEIRSTPRDNGSLILHPSDKDDARYFLLTGGPDVWTLRGWIKGADGKADEYWQEKNGNGRPAFFVPQDDLVQYVPA